MQARLADKLRAQAGHPAFRQLRLMVIQEIRRRQTQDRIAQELQALVALAVRAVLLVGIGAVGQRGFQQRDILKLITDFFFQFMHVRSRSS